MFHVPGIFVQQVLYEYQLLCFLVKLKLLQLTLHHFSYICVCRPNQVQEHMIEHIKGIYWVYY